MTVGNFNYRKMSLVRDYGALIEDEMPNEAFDRVFSLEPRPLERGAARPRALRPMARGAGRCHPDRGGGAGAHRRSYIIQGPPGTGKSQTITNLIADYVGRGKRVLFVCEKRAAIDVVFHRLRQQGLDELCCLIHDSQTDKKAFVLNLKQTYESWLGDRRMAAKAAHSGATRCCPDSSRISSAAALRSASQRAGARGVRVRELLHRLVELREHAPRSRRREAEALPDFQSGASTADLAQRWPGAGGARRSRLAGAHPFRWLGDGVISRRASAGSGCHDLDRRREDFAG